MARPSSPTPTRCVCVRERYIERVRERECVCERDLRAISVFPDADGKTLDQARGWRFLMSEVPLFLMSEVPLFLMSEVPL